MFKGCNATTAAMLTTFVSYSSDSLWLELVGFFCISWQLRFNKQISPSIFPAVIQDNFLLLMRPEHLEPSHSSEFLPEGGG